MMVVGLDLGSSYTKGVSLQNNTLKSCFAVATHYSFEKAAQKVLKNLPPGDRLGVTGYGRHLISGDVVRTEIACLAKAYLTTLAEEGTLIDIGGQDAKVLIFRDGKLVHHVMNRRCAAGTGSFVEYLQHRLSLSLEDFYALSGETKETYSFNSFCTVFSGTEILDCLQRKVPLPQLVRGIYQAIGFRIREMAPLTPPIYLCGGLAATHPRLAEVLREVFGYPVRVVAKPQFFAALGAALYAKEEVK